MIASRLAWDRAGLMTCEGWVEWSAPFTVIVPWRRSFVDWPRPARGGPCQMIPAPDWMEKRNAGWGKSRTWRLGCGTGQSRWT